jgi:Ca2+-binding RTX toxin-like protein
MTRWIKKLFAQPSLPQAPKARLGLESLDRRDLPSITWGDYAVTVTGDGSNDLVTVTRDTRNTSTVYDDKLIVRRDHGSYGNPSENLFTSLYTEPFTMQIYWPGTTTQIIKSVKANLGNGWNEFTNSTSLPSVANGGSDPDVLRGGSGQDKLYGNAGADRLYGNNGSDRLYGGDHTDYLYGGAGTDGLYGGYGIDLLEGNGGSDRYLMTQTVDGVGSLEAQDAVIRFTNTSGPIIGPSASFDNELYTGDSWTQSEIEEVDGALAVVHEAAGGPVFLEYDGDDVVFRRVGVEQVDPTGTWRNNQHVLGWNDNDGTITLDDYTFSGGATRVHEITLHEIGHNFDDENPVGQWGVFLTLSGWTPIDDANAAQILGLAYGTHRLSGDGDWIYNASQQEFTRDYARTNPMEDFAESFMMYWMHEMGETPTMATRAYDDMDVKMAFMGIFVDIVIDNA